MASSTDRASGTPPAPPAQWRGVAGMTASHRTSPVEQQARDRTYRYESNTATADPGAGGWSDDRWQERARLVLTPVAAPSILGLFGFFPPPLLLGADMAPRGGTAASAPAGIPL